MPSKPKSPFPNPAAVLPGEADLLANVIADYSDHDAKLVYADWLEERDDPRGPVLRNFLAAYRAGKKTLPVVNTAPKPWRDLVGVTLMRRLVGTEFAALADELLALARPAIAFKSTKATEKTLAVGASKLGGGPDLPQGTEWPVVGDRPLAFLGQFNLAELAVSPAARELPAAGLLSVFFDHDQAHHFYDHDPIPEGRWRVFHFSDTKKLTPRPPPGTEFWSHRVEFVERLTLPDLESPWGRGLAPKIEDDSDYWDLITDLNTHDHLLGHPRPIHGDVLGKKNVRHLLNLCEFPHNGWPNLYFTISAENLKNHRFDRAVLKIDHS
jgi:uncharacterized protein (TIGR02996 family)